MSSSAHSPPRTETSCCPRVEELDEKGGGDDDEVVVVNEEVVVEDDDDGGKEVKVVVRVAAARARLPLEVMKVMVTAWVWPMSQKMRKFPSEFSFSLDVKTRKMW